MNTKYSTLKEALTTSDGLAFLGVFMEVTFYFKWFFRHDEGTSRLNKFNSKQFFGDGSTLDFLTGNQLLRFYEFAFKIFSFIRTQVNIDGRVSFKNEILMSF